MGMPAQSPRFLRQSSFSFRHLISIFLSSFFHASIALDALLAMFSMSARYVVSSADFFSFIFFIAADVEKESPVHPISMINSSGMSRFSTRSDGHLSFKMAERGALLSIFAVSHCGSKRLYTKTPPYVEAATSNAEPTLP